MEQEQTATQLNSNGEAESNLLKLEDYLSAAKVEYNFVNYKSLDSTQQNLILENSNIATDYLLRAVLFKSKRDFFLAITTQKKIIDYILLARTLSSELYYVLPAQSAFPNYYDAQLQSYLPFAKYLKVIGVCDNSIKEVFKPEDNIFLPIGIANTLLQITVKNFLKINADCKYLDLGVAINNMSQSNDLELSKDNIVKRMHKTSITERRMKERIHETFEMPVMPTMAEQLLKLRINPSANAQNLSILVEKDPSLSAQLISWACSPYYGYSGKITSVEDAIIKVLGFDLVMNIALGIAIGQIMNVAKDGRLGLLQHWRHSLYAATFIEALVKKIPVQNRPYRGLAYLCGLLHNFGHLLLGQVFPQQFSILNHMIYANPMLDILEIEQYLFDTNHQKIGAWLMQMWHMPEELRMAVLHHHNTKYIDEDHAIYANLVLIANKLLARKSISDEFIDVNLPDEIIHNSFLTLEEIMEVFERFWNNRDGLDSVIDTLASGNK